jgi:hypothetical protein
VAKHTTSHTTVGTDMENQPARRPQSMTLSRYGRVIAPDGCRLEQLVA